MNSSTPWTVESEACPRIKVEHVFRLAAPRVSARRWKVHVAQAPSGQMQLETDSRAVLESSGQESPLEHNVELSPLARPILSLSVSSPSQEISAFVVRTCYETTPLRRSLHPTEGQQTLRLDSIESSWYRESTGSLDFKEPEFRSWLTRVNLHRDLDETVVDFARRALSFMKRRFHWIDVREFDPGHKASLVAKAGRGDCARLSVLYVAILRAAGIPARILGVRKLPSGDGHIMTDFFDANAGWIPVDVLVDAEGSTHFATDGLPEGFGASPHDYFVHYIGDGFVLPSFSGPKKILGLHSVAWFSDSGDPNEVKIEEDWEVTPLVRAAI